MRRGVFTRIGFVLFLAASGLAQAAGPVLTVANVTQIIGQAAQVATITGTPLVVVVTDREGFVLGVAGVGVDVNAPASATQVANAIAKAGTAGYLSSNAEAFTSRTAGFIIQPHFPPGIENTAPGPLTGVGFSSLPFSDINHFRNPNAALQAMGIPGTSLSGDPGGVPLYLGGTLVGGVGIDTSSAADALNFVPGADPQENIAVVAQSGFGPPQGILATQVLLNGIRLPYTDFSGGSDGVTVAGVIFSTTYPITASTGMPFQAGLAPYNAGPFPQTPIPITPVPAPLTAFPGGEVRDPIIGSPIATPVQGQPRLTQAEVTTILYQAALRASQTRGAIRNPIGPAQVFIVVIDYYNTDGAGNPVAAPPPNPPPSVAPYAFPRPGVLGSFRTPDATLFSYDVAAQKARTALFFSNNTMAMSARSVGFLAQMTYPPGIDDTTPGPYYLLQNSLSTTAPGNANAGVNPFLQNGITIFPGGFPLYRNGVLIGAIGVSGDGVDQDDIISASGTVGFEAPTAIRADQFAYRGARLPYAKFPQNSSL